MAWIESHQELARHPKTKKFARQAGLNIPAAVGHLHMLWWWAMDYAQDGDLSSFVPDDIADAILWENSPEQLISSLIHAGFIDSLDNGLHIHDWDDYAGRLIDRRKQNTKRKRESRSRHTGHVQDVRESHRATEHNQTIPNNTVTAAPVHAENRPDDGDGFKIVHDAYCETHQMLQTSPNDVMVIQRTVATGIPAAFIVSTMREVLAAKEERDKKNKQKFRMPKSFSYYEDAISDAWEREQIILNRPQQTDPGKVIPYAKSRTGPPRGSGEYDGLSI